MANGLSKAIVHGNDWLSVAEIREAKRAGFKTAFTVHMSADRENCGLDKRVELERIAGSYSDIIHFVSLSQQNSCLAHKWNEKHAQVIIPNGVDVTKFTPNKTESQDEYVLFVGRLVPEKNVPCLVKGWSQFNKKFPNVKLKILGSPGISNLDVMKEIQNLSTQQKDNVELRLEMVSEQERINYYQKSSVCCFPSSKEAFGIVAIEAQACGIPVVVGRVGGFWENTVEGLTGVHVNGLDSTSIAQGLENAYVNRKEWGNSARTFVQQFFSWDMIVDKYVENIYQPLLE
jgi:glycosyltransferase involved in cell wall biosynthesis